MIPHPKLDHLRAYAVGDLAPGRHARTASHLAGCRRCRELAAWCEAVQKAARDVTAPPVPEGTWERITSRLHAGEAVLLPASDDAFSAAPRSWHRRRGVRVAAVLLLFAGVASATVPGSPLRAWLEGRAPDAPPPGVEGVAPGGVDRAPAPAPAEVEIPEAALLVPTIAGAVAITIERPDPELRIRVRFAEGEEVEVHARGGAANAHFRTAPGRLAIADAGAGEVLLVLPRSAARFTLHVDGQPYLTAERGRLRVLLPAADTAGSEIVLSVRR